MMQIWFELGLGDQAHLARIGARLTVACVMGAIIGLQRERSHKAAGLRTHMLVALGSALFTLAPAEAGATLGEVTKVIQGIAAGIGFIGGGVILKLQGDQEVKGLTTAAGVWLTAAVGAAAGIGQSGPAMIATLLTMIILVVIKPAEQRFSHVLHHDGKSP